MSQRWYYLENGQTHGPILADALKLLADHGLLSAQTLVRNEQMADWVPAERLTGLLRVPLSLVQSSLVANSPVPNSPATNPPATNPPVANSPIANSPLEQRPPATEGLTAGVGAPRGVVEPMIPFWPQAEQPPAGPSGPWQFSIQQMMIAGGLIATAFGLIAMIYRAATLSADTSFMASCAVAASLIGGAIGVVIGKPKTWILWGTIVGVVIFVFREPALFTFAIVGGVVFLGRTVAPPRHMESDSPDRAIARRQASIYLLAAIWTIPVLMIWLPVVLAARPGASYSPRADFILSGIFLAVATLTGLYRAGQQAASPRQSRLQKAMALIAALVPLMVFAMLQWLILCALGIVYKD